MFRSIFAMVNEAAQTIPVDLNKIFKEAGIHYVEKYLADNMAGMIERNADETYTITVNKKDASPRKRFTAAHELGHYVLHRPFFDKLDDNRAFRKSGGYENSKIRPLHEAQANKFAATLLMPEEEIRRFFAKGMTTPEQLAPHFDVSIHAMTIRLENLAKQDKREAELA
jgi:Zn-dependent peptidase ImmA (M78 family)